VKASILAILALILVASFLLTQQTATRPSATLPNSKSLASVPGRIGKLNSFPATIAVSPDGRYAAMLHTGYGTQEDRGRQSISVVNLETGQVSDFPEDRLAEDAHQSFYVGIAFSGDGQRLYASLGSITDPTGQRSGNTGNAIAVYGFRAGNVTAERLIKIPPSQLEKNKWVAKGVFKTPKGTAIPYPAGLALLPVTGYVKLISQITCPMTSSFWMFQPGRFSSALTSVRTPWSPPPTHTG